MFSCARVRRWLKGSQRDNSSTGKYVAVASTFIFHVTVSRQLYAKNMVHPLLCLLLALLTRGLFEDGHLAAVMS